MIHRHILWIIVVSFLMKGAYTGSAFLVEKLDDSFQFEKDAKGIQKLFKRHDTYWYQKIHQDGYPRIQNRKELGWHNKSEYHQSSWGFMPGYPMLTKATSMLIGRSFLNAAFILSLLVSTACFLLFYWLSSTWFTDREASFYATMLFMTLPFQYYFSMMYTEALYALLLMSAFLAVQKRAYLLLGLITAYLVLVRPLGIVMLLPITVFLAESRGILDGVRLKRSALNPKTLLSFTFLILPVLSFGAYLWYQHHMTGFFNAYSIAQQEGWYRGFMFPLAALFRQGGFVHQFSSWYGICFMLLAIFLWRKLPLSYNLVLWIGMLLPLTAGTSLGMTRYVTVLFPLFWFFAEWIYTLKWKWLVIPVGFVVQLFTFYFWLINHPFSQ